VEIKQRPQQTLNGAAINMNIPVAYVRDCSFMDELIARVVIVVAMSIRSSGMWTLDREVAVSPECVLIEVSRFNQTRSLRTDEQQKWR
jgi:hypothetical protein